MATLIRTQQVLNLTGSTHDRVVFTRDADEPGDIPTRTAIALDTWADLGRPDTITVTIEPGDHLNPDA